MRKLKALPKFRNEQEEHQFWLKHDSTEYMDWSQSQSTIFAKLKPSTETISLRLPESLLSKIKAEANRLDVPYQSLMKVKLYESFFPYNKA